MSFGFELGDLGQDRGAMIWAVRSSGLMLVMEPLNARPIGDRAVATTTASGMSASLGRGHLIN